MHKSLIPPTEPFTLNLTPVPVTPDQTSELTRTVEIKEKSTSKVCLGRCGKDGDWRFATRTYVCKECREKPPHQLITRTKAKALYNLTFEQLHQAFSNQQLQMFTIPNPHDKSAAPCRLYYVHEVAQLARDLKT